MAKHKATAPTAGDGADLLAAIRARPDEDTPRLIYADWLDENKQPERAEFIRVQCALARGSEYGANRAELLLREKLLLTDKRRKVWGELPVKPVKDACFARGFVDRVSLRSALFLSRGSELLDGAPLREVRPQKVGPKLNQLLACEHLARLRSLDLHSSAISGKRAAAVAQCERLAGLHELNLGGNGSLGAIGLRALLASPHLRGLRTLHLNECHLDDALAEFLGCTTLSNLRHLNLRANGIGPAGAAHLARAEWLSQLDRLDIDSNPLTDAGVRTLADAGLLARHLRLDLRYVGLTVDGLRALGRSHRLGALRELRVTATGDGDALQAVSESPAFEHLSALLLDDGAKVTEAGVRALLRSPLSARLRALSIPYAMRPTPFRELMTAPELRELQWLVACGSGTSTEDRIDIGAVLREATQFTNLHALSLHAGWMTDDDLATFAGCAHFANLTDLRIQNGSVTSAGMDVFLESPHFARLRRAHVPLNSHDSSDPIRARIVARFGEGVYSYY